MCVHHCLEIGVIGTLKKEDRAGAARNFREVKQCPCPLALLVT